MFNYCNHESRKIQSTFFLQYFAGPWSGCSALCGEGERKRDVTCFRKDANGTVVVLDAGEEGGEDECAGLDRPAETEPCEAERPCKATEWIVSDWSGCGGEDKCGELGIIFLCNF